METRAEVCRDGFVVEGGVVVDVLPSGGPPPVAPPGDDSVAIISSVGQFNILLHRERRPVLVIIWRVVPGEMLLNGRVDNLLVRGKKAHRIEFKFW